MDEAALIIAIVALVLALVVAGFGMVLQMLIYRASTDQLLNIGKESAGLGERLAGVLGAIDKTTTITHDSVSKQMEQVTERLLDGLLKDRREPIQAGETADVPEDRVEPSEAEWEVRRTIDHARAHAIVRQVLTLLDGEDDGKNSKELREHLASAYSADESPSLSSGLDFLYVIGSLGALNAFEYKGDNMVLTETGKRAVKALASPEVESPGES